MGVDEEGNGDNIPLRSAFTKARGMTIKVPLKNLDTIDEAVSALKDARRGQNRL